MGRTRKSQHASAVRTSQGKSKRGKHVDSLEVGRHGAAVVQIIKKSLKGDSTTESYQGQINRISKWVLDIHEDRKTRLGALADTEESLVDSLDWSNPDTLDLQARTQAFAVCLDKPNWLTPRVIGAYLVKKADTDHTKHQTTDQVLAALIKHFDCLADGEKYRGDWKQVNGQWQGNPARAGTILDLKKSLMHQELSRGEPRQHSLPMTKEYLSMLHDWTYKKAPHGVRTGASHRENVELLQHSGFRLFSTMAWMLWARCFEVLRLRWCDVEFDVDHPKHPGLQYDIIRMLDRKGFEMKNASTSYHDNATLRGQEFNAYSMKDSEEPYLDLRFGLRQWRDHYEHVIKRPVRGEDYIFPAFGNGGLNPSVPATSDWPEKMLASFVADTPALQKKNGCFTTHCFRRGGAQYRFMFAAPEDRWSLTVCQRWGGWADGEGAYTIVKYLIDELYQEEHKVSDMLCPIKVNKDNPLSGTTSTDELLGGLTRLFAEWKIEIKATFSDGLLSTQDTLRNQLASLMATKHDTPRTSDAYPTAGAGPPLPNPNTAVNESISPPAPRDRSLFPSSAPLHLTVPRIDYGPLERQWENVVKDWNSPNLSRNLHMPLKDWNTDWISGGKNTTLYGVYKLRAIISREFETFPDVEAFKAAYPSFSQGTTALIKSITAKKKELNLIKPRISKKMRTAQAVPSGA